jgi:hypothetical protein
MTNYEIVAVSVQLATIAQGRPGKEGAPVTKAFGEAIRSILHVYPDVPPKGIAAVIHAAYKILKDKEKLLSLETVAKMVA